MQVCSPVPVLYTKWQCVRVCFVHLDIYMHPSICDTKAASKHQDAKLCKIGFTTQATNWLGFEDSPL